jgi:flagellar motility protein MotE (MotC chaperone)
MRRPPRHSGRLALAGALALGLALPAALSFVGGDATASASGEAKKPAAEKAPKKPEAPATAEAARPAGKATAAPGKTITLPQPEIPLAEASARPEFSAAATLEKRQRELDAQAAEIAQSRVDLERAESGLRAKIEELKALVTRQEALKAEILAAKETVKNARLDRLAQVADQMKPKDAAAYLAGLDEDVAAQLMERFSVKKAAAVTAALPTAKAAAFARLYTQRNAEQNR